MSSIGGYAFSGCSNLSVVTVKGATPPSVPASSTFPNRQNMTLYVPSGSKSAYEAAEFWADFKEIIGGLSYINFTDRMDKAACVSRWDTNGDGELDENEASAVTDLGNLAVNATTFDELRYFTGLTSIGAGAFRYSRNLQTVVIPANITSTRKRHSGRNVEWDGDWDEE